MKISVIIPTYKPKDYIYECLNSLINQTLSKEFYEVIIIINGEREPYEKEIEFFLKDKKINYKILYSKLKGVSNARNLGLSYSCGENIVFIDDDDFVSENYLKKLLISKLDKNTLIQSNVNNFYDNDLKEYEFLSRDYKPNILKRGLTEFKFSGALSTVWGKLFPREMIANITFDSNFSNGEDSLFISEISKNIKIIKTIDVDACYYRRIRKNSLHFRKRSRISKIINLLKLIKKHISIFLKKEYNKKFIFYRILSLMVGFFR